MRKNIFKKQDLTPDNNAMRTVIKHQKLTLSSDFEVEMVDSFQCTQDEVNKLWFNVVQNNNLN